VPLRKPTPPTVASGEVLDPAAVYIALDSMCCTGADGVPVIVHRGQRLRGSHPVVRQAPGLFASDGLSDDERAQLAAQLITVEPAEPLDTALAGKAPPEEMRIAVEPISTHVRLPGSDQAGLAWGNITVSIGDRLHQSHVLVRQYPERFVTPAEWDKRQRRRKPKQQEEAGTATTA
jgi:hypothetical protein